MGIVITFAEGSIPLTVTLVSPILDGFPNPGFELNTNVFITGVYTSLEWDVLRYNATSGSQPPPGDPGWEVVGQGTFPTKGLRFDPGGDDWDIPVFPAGSPCCNPYVTTDPDPNVQHRNGGSSSGDSHWFEVQLTAFGPSGSASDIGYFKTEGA